MDDRTKATAAVQAAAKRATKAAPKPKAPKKGARAAERAAKFVLPPATYRVYHQHEGKPPKWKMKEKHIGRYASLKPAIEAARGHFKNLHRFLDHEECDYTKPDAYGRMSKNANTRLKWMMYVRDEDGYEQNVFVEQETTLIFYDGEDDE